MPNFIILHGSMCNPFNELLFDLLYLTKKIKNWDIPIQIKCLKF